MRGPRPLQDQTSGHGRAVREARIAAGKTLVKAADDAGISRSRASVVENEPDFRTFLRATAISYTEALGLRIVITIEKAGTNMKVDRVY